MWGGMVVSQDPASQPSIHLGLCSLTPGFQNLCLLPPHLSRCQGPTSSEAFPQALALARAGEPLRSLWTPLRAGTALVL